MQLGKIYLIKERLWFVYSSLNEAINSEGWGSTYTQNPNVNHTSLVLTPKTTIIPLVLEHEYKQNIDGIKVYKVLTGTGVTGYIKVVDAFRTGFKKV